MSYYQAPGYGAMPPYGMQFQQTPQLAYPAQQPQTFSPYAPQQQQQQLAGYPQYQPFQSLQPMQSMQPMQPVQQTYATPSPYMQQSPSPYFQQSPSPYFQQSPMQPSPMQPVQQMQQFSPQPFSPQQSYVPQPYQIMPPTATDISGLPHISGDMVLQCPQTFIVQEKVLSATRDSFIVRDQAGQLRYKVDGTFTINERKSLKNIHGHVLLKLREARLKKREKITIFDANSIAILTLTKTSAIQIGSKRVHGYAGAQTTGSPIVVITGNYNNTLFRVMNARGQDVAIVKRKKFGLKNMLTDQDTYEVTVNQGSPALLCMITVALDEIYED